MGAGEMTLYPGKVNLVTSLLNDVLLGWHWLNSMRPDKKDKIMFVNNLMIIHGKIFPDFRNFFLWVVPIVQGSFGVYICFELEADFFA